MTQLDLFSPGELPWPGVVPGSICEHRSIIAKRQDNGKTLYCMGERVRLIQPMADGSWLAEIAMGRVWGHPWNKDGIKVFVYRRDLGAPYQHAWEL